MKQYLNVLDEILRDGREKESGRANMPNTIGINRAMIKMNLQDGFPLLTTKQMPIKTIIHELLWFLRGDTNIKYLIDNGIKIWNGDAYRWYLKWWDEAGSKVGGLRKLETIEEFVEQVMQSSNCEYEWGKNKTYTPGDLGKVYGKQWRNQNGVDQIKDVIENLQTNPYSRYHIIDAWNKIDIPDMALPPCHLLYQFLVNPLTFCERLEIYLQASDGATIPPRSHEELDKLNSPKFYLDLNMYQRSCDTFLGVPFNLASMSLLLMIIAKTCNMMPGISTWIGGDVHIYIPHIDVVKEQLTRKPYTLPNLRINKNIETLEDILALTVDDFELLNYKSHPKMIGELFTGLKK